MATECPECNEPCETSHKFCNECGYPIVPSCECSNCGAPLMDSWSHCSSCGEMADELPPGWKAKVEAKTGNTYYVNTVTRESRWDRPTGVEGGDEKKEEKQTFAERARGKMSMADADFKNFNLQAEEAVATGMQPLTPAELEQYSLLSLVTTEFRLQFKGGVLGRNNQAVDPTVLSSYEPYGQRETWGCFLKENVKEKKEGNKIWRWVCSFMLERKSSKNKQHLIRELSHYSSTKKVSIRDEIYCVLMKQLTNNDGPTGAEKAGWQLMDAMLTRFPPSLKLQMYLQAFFQTMLASEKPNSIKTFVTWAQRSLSALWGLGAFTIAEYAIRFYSWSTKHKTVGSQKISADELLMYGRTLRQPLQNIKAEYMKTAKKLFTQINKGINDKKAQESAQALSKMLAATNNVSDLVDEAFCQMLKQLAFPPDSQIEVTVAKMLNCFLDTNLPSNRLGKFLHTQIFLASRSGCTNDDAKPYLQEAMAKLSV